MAAREARFGARSSWVVGEELPLFPFRVGAQLLSTDANGLTLVCAALGAAPDLDLVAMVDTGDWLLMVAKTSCRPGAMNAQI